MPPTDPRVIYESPPGVFPSWRVERYSEADPTLIRFTKHGRTTKLLDQVARWVGGRWDPARWVPRVPTVPDSVLRVVTGELLLLEVRG